MDMIDEMIADVENLRSIINDFNKAIRMRGFNVPPLIRQGLSGHLKKLNLLNKKIDFQEKLIAQQQALFDFISSEEFPTDKYEKMQKYLDFFAKLMDTTRGAIIANNPDFESAANIYVQTPDFYLKAGGAYHEQVFNSVLAHVREERKPYLTDNVQHDDRFSGQGAITNFSLYWILVLPIIQNDEIRAFIYLDRHLKYGLWGDEERDLCATLTQYMKQHINF